jgi:hypothetical protein
MAKINNGLKPVSVELRTSEITGIGIFALINFKKGNKIFDGVSIEEFNNLISWRNFHNYSRMVQKKILAFCVGTPNGFIPPPDLDFNNLSIPWYLNHSCDGNVGFDNNGDFIAIKNINPDQELSYDYGLIESNPKFKLKCVCKKATHRKIITGNDWKMLRKDHDKYEFMHPFLKQLKGI